MVCFVGDGYYMMANSELAIMAGRVPFTVVLTDNRGVLGCGDAEGA